MKKILLLAIFLVGLSHGTVWAVEQSPTADLKPVLNDLTAVLLDENLRGDEHRVERREKIMLFVKSGFDFKEMARRILGRKWREIDSKEQLNFTELITKLLENVYIGKLENYSGQSIEFVEETVRGDRAQVTTLIENNNQKIPVHYIMRKTEPRWMVYDINIEGISLVSNYQEQFKSILRKEGYKGLVAILEEKNRSFSTENQ